MNYTYTIFSWLLFHVLLFLWFPSTVFVVMTNTSHVRHQLPRSYGNLE